MSIIPTKLDDELEALGRFANPNPATYNTGQATCSRPRGGGARIWVNYVGGNVRITVPDGGSVSIYTYHGHGWEGYDREWYRFTLNGDWLSVDVMLATQDCDGLVERGFTKRCHRRRLNTGVVDWDDATVRYPEWQTTDETYRDHTAEAAGY